jgi:hypothetical protein
MPFKCVLCEKADEWCVVNSFCLRCRRVKHLINIYGDEFYDSMESVFVRSEAQQNNKIKLARKKKEEGKVYGDESYINPKK